MPRLTRLGAHGANNAGRGRFWVAAFNAASCSTYPTGLGVMPGGRVAISTDFSTASNELLNWTVFDRSGSLVGSRTLDAANDSYGAAACADDAGNAYIVGLGWAASTHESLHKIDSSGNHVWGAGDAQAYRGMLRTMAAHGGYLLGEATPMLVRLDPADGSLIWEATCGVQMYGMDADASGNVYAVLASASGTYSLVKVDSSGAFLWGQSLQSATGVTAKAHVKVRDGFVYVVGDYDYTWTMVAKFDTSGTHQWTTTVQYVGAACIDADASGNVYAGAWDFVKLDSSGALQWSRTSLEQLNGLGCDDDGLYVLTASNVSGASFGILARLPLDGSGTDSWTLNLDGAAVPWSYSTASITTTSDVVTVAGYSTSFTTDTNADPYTPATSGLEAMSRTIATV